MKKFIRKTIALLSGLFILSSSFSVFAFDLNYSGGSTSNGTGAGNTTSGYQISVINPTYGNNVGYRFSIVDGSGNLKSGSKVFNIYLNDTTYGTAAYNSAQRFIASSGKVANKKQLASNTKVTTAYSAQACERLAGDADFYSIPGQDPATIRSWIQDTSNGYKNLRQIYAVCGLNFANVSTDDYVLIEPILRVKLAGIITAATPTELAVYGASVSGGGGYNGANGNLSNTGSGTLWNLQYYINREFPNMLYVDTDITIYSAVSVISSGRYTYNDIIQKGYGCSVLKVSNILSSTYNITYNGNGGTYAGKESHTYTATYGTDYYVYSNEGFFVRPGYTFNGWIDQNGVDWHMGDYYWTWSYDYDVTLYAQWIPNTYNITYNGNGGTYYGSSTWSNTASYGESYYVYDNTNFFVRPGYTFNGWIDQNGVDWHMGDYYWTWSYDYDVTLYAQWVPNSYTVTYSGNGGTYAGNELWVDPHKAVYGINYHVYSNEGFFVKPGYTFVGWIDQNGVNWGMGDYYWTWSYDYDVTLYAQWTPNTDNIYKVQHWLQNIDGDAALKDSDNYALAYTESFTGATGESVTPKLRSYKGFTSPDTQTVTINPDGSTVVNYYYTRNRYTVTLNKGTGISDTTGAGTYLYGASVTINAVVSQGYTWSNWTGTYNTDTQKYIFTMPCENVTDTANAVPNSYTVVYDGNGSSSGSTPDSIHIYNVEKNLNANGFERSGHSFTGWNTKADGTGTAYTDKQTVKNLTSVNGGVVTLYAQWKRNAKNVYKVQHWLQNIDGDAALKNSDNYTLADTESFTKEIYGDVNSDGYVNSADLTYLKKILLSLISEPITTGDVNGDGSTDILDLVRLKKYLAGAADESVTPEVKSYKGFTSPDTQTVTISPDGSTVVYYYYTRNSYTVTLNKGTGISDTTGAGTYLYGASVTINATVSQGYTWSKWTGTYNTATQKYTFTMPYENVTDTASAVPNSYTVVYDGNGSTGGSTPSSTHIYGVEKNLNANGYKKSGCTFIGWNTAADGTGTAYTDKQTVKNLTSVNGGVVTLYAQWQARLTLVPLEPNAPYREDTEVVTSYWIVNSSTENCIPSDNIKVAFTVYNSNGNILKTADKTVIVPARDKNLIYFKWKVPEDLSRNDVTIKAVIKDGGSNYGLISKSYATIPYIYYTTPDTEYEAKAPDGFSVPAAPTDTGILSAKWWEYKYENGSFKKVNYGIGTKLYLSPLSAPDSLSAQITGGRLTLRSGYGFRSPFGAYTLGIEGYNMPDAASYTERQYAYALFPEFNYSFGVNKCKTFKEVGDIFDFYDSYYTHINHYIPLFYPDGEYTFEIEVTDSWTPAGMITTSDLQSITVSGSLYDDHYIGRK
ncbi:MAG: InlB B-repeat-containing protein [Acutalibacteraceae bacterium]